jgi:hypothetical protein
MRTEAEMRAMVEDMSPDERTALAAILDEVAPMEPADYDTPIALTVPIKARGREYAELPIAHRPNASDVETTEKLRDRSATDMEIMRTVLGRITGIDPVVLKEIDVVDLPEVGRRFKSFFGPLLG